MSLVDHLNGLRTKDLLVTAPVVPAEEQIGAAGQDDANIRLSVAAIAAIGHAQRWRGQCRGHVPGTSLSPVDGFPSMWITVLHALVVPGAPRRPGSPRAKSHLLSIHERTSNGEHASSRVPDCLRTRG